jgi:hypothetical protein
MRRSRIPNYLDSWGRKFGEGNAHVAFLAVERNQTPPTLPHVIFRVFLATPEMDIPNIEVITLGGKRLSLKEDLREAVRFLEEDGCLVLKGATDLSPVESILATDKPSLDAVKREVALNDASKVFTSRFS